MLPTFMVIGAAKCGTTSVCDILAGHPDVFMSTPKEPHYFGLVSEARYAERRGWYESLFQGAAGYRAVGEGSVSSTRPDSVHAAARRIHEVIPDCRLVYMVRHPIRRFESDWKMLRHERRVSRSPKKAVDEMPSLISWAFYWQHLNVYRVLFPDEQILVVFLEDFAREPQTELARICRHIGVEAPTTWSEPGRARNTAHQYRSLGPLARMIKSTAWYGRAREGLPPGLVSAGKLLLTRRERHRIEWDPEQLRALADAYREDTRQLLAFCGKRPDYWNLDR